MMPTTMRVFFQKVAAVSVGTVGKDYNYLSIRIPPELLAAANLAPEDRLNARVVGDRTVYISYDPEGKQYKSGIVSINEKHFGFPLNSENVFDEAVAYDVIGEDIVITIPENAFKIRKGFGAIADALSHKLKGFGVTTERA